ncbi:metallophosphoesterase [Clostridium sp. WB02_MRS01]|nr:metallophosphoesterase [Clostridium sp. WB02_MRS01]
MDLAVLSDIHGNYIALEKSVEYALSRGVKSFAFLGDYVGELA